MLRWSAFGLAVVVAGWLIADVWHDTGVFTLVLLGLPVLVCLAAVLASGSRYARAVTWGAAAVVLGWSLVLGLGIGLFFLPVAVLLAAAAARHHPVRSRPLRR